jgi:hypothetical protein
VYYQTAQLGTQLQWLPWNVGGTNISGPVAYKNEFPGSEK